MRIAVLFAALLPFAAAAQAADSADQRRRLQAGRGFWAFQPIVDPLPPATASPWARTPVDAFILAKLTAAGLQPAPPVSKEKLLRRVYLDLIGLPRLPKKRRNS